MVDKLHFKVGKEYIISKPTIEEIEFTFIGGEPPKIQTKDGIYTLQELLYNCIELREK